MIPATSTQRMPDVVGIGIDGRGVPAGNEGTETDGDGTTILGTGASGRIDGSGSAGVRVGVLVAVGAGVAAMDCDRIGAGSPSGDTVTCGVGRGTARTVTYAHVLPPTTSAQTMKNALITAPSHRVALPIF